MISLHNNRFKNRKGKHRIRSFSAIMGLCIVSLFLFSCSRTVLVSSSQTVPRNINFEEVIETAKRKVFPALVFVKPIVEEYESGEKKKQRVFGSGVIISPDGYVVTNNHVVEKSLVINCVLWNKKQVDATLIGRDPETDLALLKLDYGTESQTLPYAEFADSGNLEEGQFVMALGAPFGFTRSISLGIISNTTRYLGFESIYKYNVWLQTDAAINPGNSGGPLVNTEGKIVGINTLGMMIIGENIGFAIPSNVVRDIVERLKKNEEVMRAWSGLQLQPLNDFYSNTFIDAERGVLISDVDKNSPAREAGVKSGDLLLAVNNTPIMGLYAEDLPQIRWLLADLPVDSPSIFNIQRGDSLTSFSITPVLKGKVEGEDFDLERWDMTVKEINKFKNPEHFFYKKQGVFIQGVKYPGNAANARLHTNDIILSIDRQEINSLEDIKTLYNTIMEDTKREKKVLLELLRSGYKKWIVLDYRKDYDEEE